MTIKVKILSYHITSGTIKTLFIKAGLNAVNSFKHKQPSYNEIFIAVFGSSSGWSSIQVRISKFTESDLMLKLGKARDVQEGSNFPTFYADSKSNTNNY